MERKGVIKNREFEEGEWLKPSSTRYCINGVVTDPLKWWVDELAHLSRFIGIGQTALDLAMSAECERIFSRAKRTITDGRSGLKESTIDVTECQKDWLRILSELSL